MFECYIDISNVNKWHELPVTIFIGSKIIRNQINKNKIENDICIENHTEALKAWSKSAIRSPTSSRPIDRRMKLSVMPKTALSSALTDA